jgi:small subunit ribosomal protein S20
MPNLKSAKKRMRSNETCHARNLAVRTKVKNTRRKFMEAAESKEVTAMESTFREYCSALDKAAKKKVIKKNNAIRRKRCAANRLRAAAVA